MDYIKQYIIQAITIAVNNLRLDSAKIEAVTIIKNHLRNCNDLLNEITRMKKITELSRLGIKLGEIVRYFESNNIDFLTISDDFKKHSSSLISILSNLLDATAPRQLNEILKERTGNEDLITIEDDKSTEEDEELPLKAEIIMDELDGQRDKSFEEFQKQILKPVRGLEEFLNRLSTGDYHKDEVKSYISVMKINSELSEREGVKVIAQMHVIFAVALKLIWNDKMLINQSVIESLRACLIVIVAMIKGKNVDITTYLDRAEKFGEQILQYK
jgi:hypothetical protein